MSLITEVTEMPADGASPSGMLTTSLPKVRVQAACSAGSADLYLIQKAEGGQWFKVPGAVLRLDSSVPDLAKGQLFVDNPIASTAYHVLQERGGTVATYLSGANFLAQPATVGAHASDHLAGGSDPLLASPGDIGGTTPGAGTFTDVTTTDDLVVGDDATITGDVTVGGTLGVTGTLTTTAAAAVGTSLTVGTSQTFAKEVNHTVSVAASTTAATAGGNLTINSGNGNGAAGGVLSLDTGSGTSAAAWNLGATNGGTGTIGRTGQTVALAGDATVAGTLAVTGASTLTGQLNANGGAKLAGNAPTAAADAVTYGVADINGATTAAEKKIYEGGASLTERVNGTGAAKQILISEDIADDATIALPAPASGKVGRLEINEITEWGLYSVQSDGTITKLDGSTNAVTTDTDAKLAFFSSTGTPTIRNRLGSTLPFVGRYLYY